MRTGQSGFTLLEVILGLILAGLLAMLVSTYLSRGIASPDVPILRVQRAATLANGMKTRTLKVNIPAGVRDGQKIRLAGQGSPGGPGSEHGDLYLRIKVRPHPQFKVKDDNVVFDLALTPWEAALGTSVRVPTLDGAVELRVPPGVGSGAKLRVRGKGLGTAGKRGDELVRIMVQTPKALTDDERRLFEELAKVSTFNPRA